MSLLVDVLSGALLLAASGFVLLAAVGLHRFDDLFSRVHAQTKAATLGVVLVALGTALQMEGTGDGFKLLLVALLQLVSAPVSGHMISRAAYWAGDELSPETAIDQLAESDLEH